MQSGLAIDPQAPHWALIRGLMRAGRRSDAVSQVQNWLQHCGKPAALANELLETYQDGRVKMWVLHRTLSARKQRPLLFSRGDYLPLECPPEAVAFARRFEDDALICCVPRLSYRLSANRSRFPIGAVWGERSLSVADPGSYENALTGARLQLGSEVRLAQLFEDFPLALLLKVRS